MSKKHALLQPDIVILAPPTYATPRPTHIDRLPGPQPPRHEPVTGRERTNSKSSPQRPRGLPPSYRVRLPMCCTAAVQSRYPGASPSLMPSSTRLAALLPRRPSVPLTVHWTHDHCARLQLRIYARAVLSTTQGCGMFTLSLPITQPVLTRDRAISPFCLLLTAASKTR